MSEPLHPSDHPSARVGSTTDGTAGQRPISGAKGPESVSSPALGAGDPERGGGRKSNRQLLGVAVDLSDRDLAITRSVNKFGFLMTHHIQQLHFHDHATPDACARSTRRVLARLHRDRVVEPIERRIGGIRAGSASYVWRVGPSGDRLLRASSDAPRARRKEPSLRFLQHRLAVADCYCALQSAEHRGELELLEASAEPGSWREFTGSHGGREILKPDLFAITASGEFEDHWFIEIDLGTESVPTVMKQCAQYQRYRRSGREQQRSGVFPRVLWLVPDEHRRDRLRTGIAAARDLGAELHHVELATDVVQAVRAGAQ